MDFRAFCTMVIEVTRQAMVKMAENGRKLISAVIWQEMDFRAFHVVAIEVARKTMAEMAENGGKWISAVIWQEMDFRVFYVIPLLLFYGSQNQVLQSVYLFEERYTQFFTLLHLFLMLYSENNLLAHFYNNRLFMRITFTN